MPLPPFAKPIPTIAPITACVLETGTAGSGGKPTEIRKSSSPCEENRINTSDCDKMTIHATTGEKDSTFLPTVLIAFCEYVNTPTQAASAPSKKSTCTPLKV